MFKSDSHFLSTTATEVATLAEESRAVLGTRAADLALEQT
jgi:hypothetical protein